MDFKALREANTERARLYPMKNKPTDLFWAAAIAGEAGEMCNFVKKEYRDMENYSDDIAKELADIIIYCDLFAAQRGIDLEEAVRQKFNEVSDRINVGVKL